MTAALTESTEWTLIYDDTLEWHTDTPLWDATTMLNGLFQGIGIASEQIPAYIKANYERPVTVLWNGVPFYEGSIGRLALIVLDELADAQQEKGSAGLESPALR